ncbi:DUF4097 family beta strand repeat-containing protein [Algoriphagus machipongonensis]|uniref:Lipoprotein n=1 Tax=Algoriphagus machipongonensis TaxID=388413 RepID=A3HTJ0_9BACT|nr:DUF4097 family beta strand repeat-containing protein [Algoriphagus machipongonensis]EAZ83158.1 lipoprotein [Algoriphagus machipongonensis]
MKFKRNFNNIKINLSIFSLIVLLSSCYQELEVVQTINEEFTGINEVEIESGFLDVVYLGDPEMTTVQMDALLESSKKGRYEIKYREEQGKLIIELDQKKLFGSGRDKGRIYLNGPEEMELDIAIGSGKGTVSNVLADDFRISAGSGNLVAQNIEANSIQLKASSGKIEANYLIGELTVSVNSGNVSLGKVQGNVTMDGSSGNLQVNDVEGLLEATLNSGNINLIGVEQLGFLKVSSGKIKAVNSGLSGSSEFHANSGSINIQTFSDLSEFNYDLTANSGNLKVGNSSSGGKLKIDNGSPYTVSGAVSSGRIEIRN